MYIDFNRENDNNYISYNNNNNNNNNNNSWLIEYKNIKIFLQKFAFKIGLKKFKKVLKVQNTVSWKYVNSGVNNVISDLNREDIDETFYKKQLRKTNQKEFRVEKVIKRNAINYMLNRKAKIVLLTLGLIKIYSINEWMWNFNYIYLVMQQKQI